MLGNYLRVYLKQKLWFETKNILFSSGKIVVNAFSMEYRVGMKHLFHWLHVYKIKNTNFQ